MARRCFPAILSFLACLTGAADRAPAQATGDPIKPTVFVWKATTNQPGLTPMTWVAPDTQTPDKAAQLTIAAFNRRPAGQRAVFISHLGLSPLLIDPKRVYYIVRDGPNLAPHVKWTQSFYTKLKNAGLPPDRIVLDYEAGLSVFQIDQPNIPLGRIVMPIYNDPKTAALLPTELTTGISPADFDGGPRQRAAWNAWNAWTGNLVSGYVRQIVLDPTATAFGQPVPTTNYGASAYSFQCYDLNGWPASTNALAQESSPPLYLDPIGNRYRNRAKSAAWNKFIDAVNHARSTSAHGPLVPWLSYPSFGGDTDPWGGNKWLWAELVKHTNALGVRTYLLWNPQPYKNSIADPALMDDQYASQVFASLKLPPAPTTRPTYPEVPLDAEQVTTGSVTTRYVDFMAGQKAAAAGLPIGAAGPVPRSAAGATTSNVTIYVPTGGSTLTTSTTMRGGKAVFRKSN